MSPFDVAQVEAQAVAFLRDQLAASRDPTLVSASEVEYRVGHALRAANYGRQIAAAEGADPAIVALACLLHDIAKYATPDYLEHGRAGAALCRSFLLGAGVPQAETDHICFAIAGHVDGQAGMEHPETIEVRVMNDADNVDRYGALRMIQKAAPYVADYERLVRRVRKRIETLHRYREQRIGRTATGQRMLDEVFDLQLAVLTALVQEYELTRLPARDQG